MSAALVVTGTDVTVGDVIATDTTMTATLTIAPTASPSAEPRLLIVTTESGQTTIEFFIIAACIYYLMAKAIETLAQLASWRLFGR